MQYVSNFLELVSMPLEVPYRIRVPELFLIRQHQQDPHSLIYGVIILSYQILACKALFCSRFAYLACSFFSITSFFFLSSFYLTSTLFTSSSTFVAVFFAASIVNTPLFIFASIFEGIISSGIAIVL
jgi:hypothetical protein